ncbi:hypothetical protein AB0A73_13380 [Glycomyces sp. NPDC047369]
MSFTDVFGSIEGVVQSAAGDLGQQHHCGVAAQVKDEVFPSPYVAHRDAGLVGDISRDHGWSPSESISNTRPGIFNVAAASPERSAPAR